MLKITPISVGINTDVSQSAWRIEICKKKTNDMIAVTVILFYQKGNQNP
jgi:hypothetical protein